MKIANISTTKNNLSKLLNEVRNGESIIIVDRDTPVARLEPIGKYHALEDRLPALARNGTVHLPEIQIDVETFINHIEKTHLRDGASVNNARSCCGRIRTLSHAPEQRAMPQRFWG